jgi:Raf kinase inhibitor-like YbhB/YbcL family protein
MILTSPAFQDYGPIDRKFTCDGVARDNPHISPPLAWSDLPDNARSLVLIVEDEDATDGYDVPLSAPWVHWVLYNIPTSATLPEGVGLPEREPLPAGTLEGLNGREQTGYRGPCPPQDRHHYFFRLLALNGTLSGLNRPSKNALLNRIRYMGTQGPIRVIAHYDLVGTYDGPPPPPPPGS